MKPHPHCVLAGIKATAGASGDCVMAGDSITDIEVARAISVRRIAYAPFDALRQIIQLRLVSFNDGRLCWPERSL